MSDGIPDQSDTTIVGDLGDALSAELRRQTQEHEARQVGRFLSELRPAHWHRPLFVLATVMGGLVILNRCRAISSFTR